MVWPRQSGLTGVNHVLLGCGKPVQPKTSYQPLFAYAVTEGVRKCRGGQIRTADLLVPNQAPCRWATPRFS